MALIKCPECGQDVSTSAYACPHCGYPVAERFTETTIAPEEEEFRKEVERLLKHVKRVNFDCPDPHVKVCAKCGAPFCYHDNDPQNNGKPSCDCNYNGRKYPGVEVDYPEYQMKGLLGENLYIFEKCVVPNNIGDKGSAEYKENKNLLYTELQNWKQYCASIGQTGWDIEPEPPDEKYFGLRSERGFLSGAPAPAPKNVPTCPYCHSTDLTKISNTKKTVKALAFGIYGALDDSGKTWKCNHCGSKF